MHVAVHTANSSTSQQHRQPTIFLSWECLIQKQALLDLDPRVSIWNKSEQRRISGQAGRSTIAVPLQHHCSTMAVPWQYHCSTIAVPLQHHCSTIVKLRVFTYCVLAAPARKNIGQYLLKHPDCELYSEHQLASALLSWKHSNSKTEIIQAREKVKTARQAVIDDRTQQQSCTASTKTACGQHEYCMRGFKHGGKCSAAPEATLNQQQSHQVLILESQLSTALLAWKHSNSKEAEAAFLQNVEAAREAVLIEKAAYHTKYLSEPDSFQEASGEPPEAIATKLPSQTAEPQISNRLLQQQVSNARSALNRTIAAFSEISHTTTQSKAAQQHALTTITEELNSTIKQVSQLTPKHLCIDQRDSIRNSLQMLNTSVQTLNKCTQLHSTPSIAVQYEAVRVTLQLLGNAVSALRDASTTTTDNQYSQYNTFRNREAQPQIPNSATDPQTVAGAHPQAHDQWQASAMIINGSLNPAWMNMSSIYGNGFWPACPTAVQPICTPMQPTASYAASGGNVESAASDLIQANDNYYMQ